MSSISSLFKGYNANRKPKVRKGVPYGRCAEVITAKKQYIAYFGGPTPDKYLTPDWLAYLGFRDIRYHYTKGWRIA